MKRLLVFVLFILLATLPCMAQNVRVEGNVSSTEQNVYDASGRKTALKLGTTTVGVDGQFTTGGFDAVLTSEMILCGDLAASAASYCGPALGWFDGTGTDSSIASTACDALDSTTEATADAPIGFANSTFKVYGMLCEVSGSGSNGVVIAARSAEADLSPSLSCTIATSETSCVDVLASPATVTAGATIAIAATSTEDLSAQDVWCKWFIGFTE